MECSQPGTIREEELIAYLAGDTVRPAVLEHLARCPHCSSQLESYRQLDRKLVSKLYRWDCPTNMVLGEYYLGMLALEQAIEIKKHLDTCVLCAAEVAALSAFLAQDPVEATQAAGARKNIPVRTVSPNQHRAVREAIDHLHDQARSGIRRIIASLLPPQPLLSPTRTSKVAEWPRNYAAEDLRITMALEQGAGYRDTLKLIGFVQQQGKALEAFEGTTVQLSTGQTAYTQQVDELGNFVFSPVAPATYTLELQFQDSIVVIDQLVVSA